MLTATYVGFALAQAALAVWAFALFARRRSLGAFVVALPIALLVWDNSIVALGALLGDGPLLVALSWPRFIGHALFTPIWIITAFEYARRAGAGSLRGRWSHVAEWALYGSMAALGFARSVVLLRLEPVVQGDLFYYTNGGGFPGPPIPALVMVVVLIAAGVLVLRATGWRWMLIGGVVMFVAAAIPTSIVGFFVSNAGEVALSLALVATERFLQQRESASLRAKGASRDE
ncbi:MAG: hypothetical protein Q7W16_07285 [Coriobacteriia bacterium]|nr:hypothetical protein [Coriobacteriia bacterium]